MAKQRVMAELAALRGRPARDTDRTPEQRIDAIKATLLRAAEKAADRAAATGIPTEVVSAAKACAEVQELLMGNKPTEHGGYTVIVEGLNDADADADDAATDPEPAAAPQVQ